MTRKEYNQQRAVRQTSFHRLRDVRLKCGFSLRTMAARMDVPLARVIEEEEPQRDISIAQLRRWSSALEVPMSELLIESTSQISLPGLTTERLAMLERLTQQLTEASSNHATRAFADGLTRQLRELHQSATFRNNGDANQQTPQSEI